MQVLQPCNCLIAGEQPDDADSLAVLLQERRHCDRVVICHTKEDLINSMSRDDVHMLFISPQYQQEELMPVFDMLRQKNMIVLFTNNPGIQDEGAFEELIPGGIKRIPLLPAPVEATTTEDFFFIRDQRRYIRIDHKDILYIEANKNYYKVVTPDKTHTVLGSLNRLEKKLPPDVFIRIHRSFIVPWKAIREVDQFSVLVHDQWLPVGEAHRPHLLEKIKMMMV